MGDFETLEELGRRFVRSDRELVVAIRTNGTAPAVDARFSVPEGATTKRYDRIEKRRVDVPLRPGPDGQRGLWITSAETAAWLGAALLEAAEKLEKLAEHPDGGPAETPREWHCGDCGTKNDDDARDCRRCGVRRRTTGEAA